MRAKRMGLTIVEVLVVIAVIAGILVLLIPAIQFTREASRRVSCVNNLRMFGIAIHNYESSHRFLPPLSGPFDHSIFVSLLPHLEQQSLFDSYRFDWNGPGAELANDKFRKNVIPNFMCPSNGSQKPRCDYLANQGSRIFYPYDGPFAYMAMMQDKTQTRSADIFAGTSNVVAMSETKLHGRTVSSQRTDNLVHRSIIDEASANRYIAECRDSNSPRIAANPFALHGFWWDLGGQTKYQHIMKPNFWDCSNGNSVSDGIYTANSTHSSGVNALYMDNHVEFKMNDIEDGIWFKIGQR